MDTRKILAETADGDQSEFMETVRSQYQDEVGQLRRLVSRFLASARSLFCVRCR